MMVLSEYFSSTSGVGYVLLISKNTFQLAPMWAAIVLIGAARLPAQPRSSCSSSGACSPGTAAGARPTPNSRSTHDARDQAASARRTAAASRRRTRSATSRSTVDEGEFVCVVGPSGLRQDDAAQVHRGPAAARRAARCVLSGKRVTGAARGDGARLPGVRPLADAVDVGAQQRAAAAAAQEARRGPSARGSSRRRWTRSG